KTGGDFILITEYLASLHLRTPNTTVTSGYSSSNEVKKQEAHVAEGDREEVAACVLPPVHFPPTCRNFIDPVSSTKRVVEFCFQTAGLGQNSVGTWVKNALAITFDVCGSTASRSGLAQ
ncbi:TPA: hypothetical protein ACSXWN_006214, partial [Pseudomonas aeruginosa]